MVCSRETDLLDDLEVHWCNEIKPIPDTTVEEWAESPRGIMLSERFSEAAGPWRARRTPYVRLPLKLFTDESIRRILLCWATQTAKSTVYHCCLGYVVDIAPGPALGMYPTQPMAKAISKDRIMPTVEASAGMSAHLTGRKEDFQQLAYTFDRMTFRFAWSFSESSARAHPIRYLFEDERSAFAAGAAAEAEERTKRFWNHKILAVSTPVHQADPMWTATGLKPVHDELTPEDLLWTSNWVPKTATTVYFHEVPCPRCGVYIRLEFPQIRWPKDIAIRQMDVQGWYECQECGGRIDDADKPEMLARGEWKTSNPGGEWVAFHLSSLYAPWESCRFGAIANLWVRAKLSNDPDTIQKFVNNWLALPYSPEAQATAIVSEAALASSASIFPYQRNTIPEPVKVLVLGADVQLDTIYWVIFGFGSRGRCWRIGWGRDPKIIATPEELGEWLIATRWTHPTGAEMKVKVAGVDSRYHRDSVVGLARRLRGTVYPIRGMPEVRTPGKTGLLPWKAVAAERTSKGKPIAGSVIAYNCNTVYWKQWLYRRLNCEHGQEPTIFAPSERDETYERHLRSEHQVRRRKRGSAETVISWEIRKGFEANHWLDATVYMACIAHAKGYMNLKENARLLAGIPSKVRANPKPQGMEFDRFQW